MKNGPFRSLAPARSSTSAPISSTTWPTTNCRPAGAGELRPKRAWPPAHSCRFFRISRSRVSTLPPGRIQVLTGLFAEGLLSMSAGQHEDLLASRGEGVTPPACRAMVERKSGAETALFARSAAVLAGADPAVADSYGAFGLCLGAGAQIGSDLGDIFDPGGSRDLLNGKLTLPIVHALTVLKDRDREAFLRLLDSARQSIEPHEEARKVLMRAGSVRYTALVIEVYRQKALSHLAAAPVSGGGFAGHAGKALRSLVDGISLAGRGTAAGLAICFR